MPGNISSDNKANLNMLCGKNYKSDLPAAHSVLQIMVHSVCPCAGFNQTYLKELHSIQKSLLDIRKNRFCLCTELEEIITSTVWLGEGWCTNSLVDQRRLAKSQRKILHIILELVDPVTKQSSHHFSVRVQRRRFFFNEGGDYINVSLKDVLQCSV